MSDVHGKGRLVYLHALTPIHSGTGQAADVIDLPIAREKATGWPIIPATSVKGVIRDALSADANKEWMDRVFGKAETEGSQAGALCFGDQRILCLPVRSFFGTFAYVTCPLVLNRLLRDAKALGVPAGWDGAGKVEGSQVLVAEGSALVHENKVYLEDLDLDSEVVAGTASIASDPGKILGKILGIDNFSQHFAIVADDVFSFLCETATEVSARVRLSEESKTVASGGLWYEEAVPAEAIFAGLLLVNGVGCKAAQTEVGQALEALKNRQTVQIGGKASVGRGLCRLILTGGDQ